MRFATPHEVDNWDSLIIKNPNGGDVFQTKAFAAIKASQGWTPHFVIYDVSSQHVACLYITRSIPLLGELWYAPKGPGVINRTSLEHIVAANHAFATAQARSIFAFKLEPDVPKNQGYPALLHKVHTIQPNANTVVVDLSPSEDDIRATFRQRARRAIRQAQTAGVTVEAAPPSQKNFQHMYELYKTTGERARFHVRDLTYHKTLWQQWIQTGQGQLFFAHHQGGIVAGAFVAFVGVKGLYKDGASDRQALKNGAAHLLQWEIMRWLKSQGIARYDLHGTPPADQLENTQHPFYGLGLFKTSFAPHITEYVGTLDQPIKPAHYKQWRRFGERAAQRFEYRVRGRTFY
ncbi:MAG TPA: peptidoglycan bridge formation glycyltransferase FemA/FemB family protein [Candidatus Saccharimonadales bacterium]|nr:peptidoglycan bridge formation glycyltransferase FemA/FemB family protein [Candidatus Saccharimonadales bacterium]